MIKDKAVPVLWILLLIFIPVWRQIPVVLGLEDFSDDARLYVYTLWKNIDSDLFANDPVTDYVRRSMMPPGYTVVSATAASLFNHPLTAMYFVTVLLLLLVVGSCYAVGLKLIGTWGACISVALILQSNSVWALLMGGLPKSFALPFLTSTVALWMYGKERTGIFLQSISAFFYPPVYLLLAFTGVLRIVFRFRSGNRPVQAPLFVFINASVVILLSLWIYTNPYGPTTSGDKIRSDPHWVGEHRRYKDYPFDPVHAEFLTMGIFPSLPEHVGRDMYHLLEPVKIPLLMIAIFLLVILIHRDGGKQSARRVFKTLQTYEPISILLATVVMLYSAARIFELTLFMPNRYLTLGLPFIVSVSMAAFFIHLIRRIPFPLIQSMVLYSITIASIIYESNRENYGFTRSVPEESRAALKQVSALPKHSLVYATGEIANDIPLIAARPVVWNYETYQVYHHNYVKQTDQRIRRIMDLLLSSDWNSAKSEFNAMRVTHLIYDKALWRDPHEWNNLPRQSWILLSPLWEEYKGRLTVATKQQRLLWNSIPSTHILYEDMHYRIFVVNKE